MIETSLLFQFFLLMEMLLKQSSHYYAKKSDEVGADIEKDDDQISL